MGLMYGYVYEGTYKYDDFNKSGNSYSLKPGVPHYSTETNTQPGMPKYADLNGDGVVDSNDLRLSDADFRYIQVVSPTTLNIKASI